jgi:hypothetical protein
MASMNKVMSCDVLVVGGGVAGTVAAIASARGNVYTILVEKNSFLGGIGYSGLHQYICGLYLNSDTLPRQTLNKGILREIVISLNKLSPYKKIKRIGRIYVLPYLREDLQLVFQSLTRNLKKLDIFYNMEVVGIEKKNDKISEVNIYGSEAVERIIPKVVIDCTGDGNLSAMAGAVFELSPPEKRQLAGYTIGLRGLKNVDDTLPIKVSYYLTKAVNKGKLSSFLRFTTFTPGDALDEGYCKLSIDTSENTKRKRRAKDYALKVHHYLANSLLTFKDSYIFETSGVVEREGRRICGEYTLTEEDVLNARKLSDGVVKNSWPIEIWDRNKGLICKYLESGDYYEIPLRCLKVKSISNLLCAGRCISVSHEALGSTRVMGTCMALGEQAGKATVRYIKNSCFNIEKKDL